MIELGIGGFQTAEDRGGWLCFKTQTKLRFLLMSDKDESEVF